MKNKTILFRIVVCAVLMVCASAGATWAVHAQNEDELFLQQDMRAIRRTLEEAYQAGNLIDADHLWLLASLYVLAGEGAQAADVGKAAFALDPDQSALSFRRMGVLMYQLGEYEEAAYLLGEVVGKNPWDEWAWYHVVLVSNQLVHVEGKHLYRESLDEGIQSLEKLLEAGVSIPSQAYYHLGKYYLDARNTLKAVEYFSQYIRKHDPTTSEEGRYMLEAANYINAYGSF